MAWNGAVFDLGRPFKDGDRVDNATTLNAAIVKFMRFLYGSSDGSMPF